MAIQAAERLEWAHNLVTKELLEQLRSSKQESMEAWAAEAFVGASQEQGSLQNALALGGVRVLVDLITQLEEMQQTEGGAA
jgi:hypothetical protein